MNSFFDSPRLKRTLRTRTRKLIRPISDRFLQTIPELSEDEQAPLTLRSDSPYAYESPIDEVKRQNLGARAKRASGVFVLTAPLERVQSLSEYSFDTDQLLELYQSPRSPQSPRRFSRPLPLIPDMTVPSSPVESEEEPFTFVSHNGRSFDFPHPPLSPVSIVASFRQENCTSPSPSIATSHDSGSTSSPRSEPDELPTPSTSDDEFCLPRAVVPRRACIKPLCIPSKSLPRVVCVNEEDEDDGHEFYMQELKDLFEPVVPVQEISAPAASSTPKLRPDSICRPPSPPVPSGWRKRSGSKRTARPSAALDPEMACSRKRVYPPVPKRAPPPPPMPAAQKLSLSPVSPRPPPRSAIPDDVDESDDVVSRESVYSQEMDIPEFDFDCEVDAPLSLPVSLPSSPLDLQMDAVHGIEAQYLSRALPEIPTFDNGDDEYIFSVPNSASYLSMTPGLDTDFQAQAQDMYQQGLRSRWSSSTLSSAAAADASSPTVAASAAAGSFTPLLKFYFGSRSSAKPVPKRSSAATTTASPSKATVVAAPAPAAPRTSTSSNASASAARELCDDDALDKKLRRRGSTSTVGSEESSGSSGSGLRRKPIPVEMFLRC